MSAEQLFEKIAQVRPNVFAFFAGTVDEVRQSPFREEIVERLSGLVKAADGLGNWSKGVGAQVAQGIAYNLAGDLYDSLRRGLTKSRNYRKMLAGNPDIKNLDGNNVRRAFGVLHQFNPAFASNPAVAGDFVRRNASLSEGSLGDLSMLTGLSTANKNINDSKKLPVGQVSHWDSESSLDKQHKQKQIDQAVANIKKLEQEAHKLKKEDGQLFDLKIKQLQQQTNDTLHDLKIRGAHMSDVKSDMDLAAQIAGGSGKLMAPKVRGALGIPRR